MGFNHFYQIVFTQIVRPKLINAQYCSNFVHVRWKDGSLVHVQITPELYRLYARRMKSRLTAIQQRLNWLRQGSRELYGTITEDEVSKYDEKDECLTSVFWTSVIQRTSFILICTNYNHQFIYYIQMKGNHLRFTLRTLIIFSGKKTNREYIYFLFLR